MHRPDGDTSWFDPLGERGFHREVGAFVDAIRGGGRSPVPVDDGYAGAAHGTGRAGVHPHRASQST